MKNKVILVSNNDPELYKTLVKDLSEKKLIDDFQIKQFNAFGLNSYQSMIKIYPDNLIYVNLKKEYIPLV